MRQEELSPPTIGSLHLIAAILRMGIFGVLKKEAPEDGWLLSSQTLPHSRAAAIRGYTGERGILRQASTACRLHASQLVCSTFRTTCANQHHFNSFPHHADELFFQLTSLRLEEGELPPSLLSSHLLSLSKRHCICPNHTCQVRSRLSNKGMI